MQRRRDEAARNVTAHPRGQVPSGIESPPHELIHLGSDARLAVHVFNLGRAENISAQAGMSDAALMVATFRNLLQRLQHDTPAEVLDYATESFQFFQTYVSHRPSMQQQIDLDEEQHQQQQTDQQQQTEEDESKTDLDDNDRKPPAKDRDAKNKK
jgi:hypothetical protein